MQTHTEECGESEGFIQRMFEMISNPCVSLNLKIEKGLVCIMVSKKELFPILRCWFVWGRIKGVLAVYKLLANIYRFACL